MLLPITTLSISAFMCGSFCIRVYSRPFAVRFCAPCDRFIDPQTGKPPRFPRSSPPKPARPNEPKDQFPPATLAIPGRVFVLPSSQRILPEIRLENHGPERTPPRRLVVVRSTVD